MSMLKTESMTIHFTEWEKEQRVDLLKPHAIAAQDGEYTWVEHVYSVEELRKLTLELMRYVSLPYDPCLEKDGYREITDKKKFEDFTDEEKRIYYPFAFMLACLDGNAFREGQINPILQDGDKLPPSPSTIECYIPDAYRIFKANSGTNEELLRILKKSLDISIVP